MKYILLILLLGIVLGIIGLAYKLTNPVFLSKKSKRNNGKSNEPLSEIPAQKVRLYADVQFLTSLQPARNSKNLVSMEKSVDYIQTIFTKLNFKTEIQAYQTPDGNTYKNVIASIGPDTKERIVIGAHYDVCGEQAGADDNASAVAGLLEIARLVDELKPNLKYRIDFVAFALEEPPYFRTQYMGSAVHARSLKAQNMPLKAMICLEMIGYFNDAPNSQAYPLSALKTLYPSVANFIAVVGKLGQDSIVRQVKTSMLKGAKIPVYSINAPEFIQGIDFSDHRNYWAEGYQAVMITNTSFFRNHNYHQATDTIETLDFDRMTEVVKGAYWALVNL